MISACQRRWPCLAALALASVAATAVAQTSPSLTPVPADLAPSQGVVSDRRLLYPDVHQPALSAGDLITVRLYGQADYAPSVRIAADGSVVLPLVGSVELQGLTVSEAGRRIAERLAGAGMYRDPQVTVQVTEGPNASVTILGEVHSIVPVTGSRRLLDVLAAGGGIPATASHIVTIHRPGLAQPIVVDLGPDLLTSELGNIPVFPGDTIILSPVGIVYMVGEFKKTGVLPLAANHPLTLMQAASLSDGFLFDAKYDDTRIIRTVGDKRTIMKVDIKAVLYGKAADPILEPGDIVFLPNSALKAAISNGTVSTVLGISGLIVALAIR